MQRQRDAELLGHRRHAREEFREMLPQDLRRDVAIGLQPIVKLRDRHRLGGRARQRAGDDHDEMVYADGARRSVATHVSA